MKNLKLLSIIAFSAGSLFAATETPQTGYIEISGSLNATNFAELNGGNAGTTSYASPVLFNNITTTTIQHRTLKVVTPVVGVEATGGSPLAFTGTNKYIVSTNSVLGAKAISILSGSTTELTTQHVEGKTNITIDTSRIIVEKGATLNLNINNANSLGCISYTGGYTTLSVSGKTTVVSGKENHFKLDVKESKALILNTSSAGGQIYIEGYETPTVSDTADMVINLHGGNLTANKDGAVYFLKDTAFTWEVDQENDKIIYRSGDIEKNYAFRNLDGQKIANLTIEETAVGSATYFKVSVGEAIPEPAEWAAIFGGIALALAIYRRRK